MPRTKYAVRKLLAENRRKRIYRPPQPPPIPKMPINVGYIPPVIQPGYNQWGFLDVDDDEDLPIVNI